MENKYKTIETVLDVITAIAIVVGLVNSIFIMIWAILTLIFAGICKKIGTEKGIDYGFLVGWFLGIIGLIVILVIPGNTDNKNTTNKYEDLARLQKLKEEGTITEIEFEIEKAKLLK